MKKIALGCLSALAIATIVLGGISYYIANWLAEPHDFNETLSLPLPPEIGGTVNVDVSGVAMLDFKAKEGTMDMRFQLTPQYLNDAMPTADISMLVNETDNPNIISMLGRLNLVPQSALLTVSGSNLVFGAQLTGELYVRESRKYERDEEQPGSDDALPMAANLLITAANVGLTPQWTAHETTLIAEIRLDEQTISDWHGRYGDGRSLADLVERSLNERLTANISRLDFSSLDLRDPLYLIMERTDARLREQDPQFGLYLFTVNAVTIDNCLTQSPDGTLELGLAVSAGFNEDAADSNELPTLPELTIRPSPC